MNDESNKGHISFETKVNANASDKIKYYKVMFIPCLSSESAQYNVTL
jgi:hypothetical protein